MLPYLTALLEPSRFQLEGTLAILLLKLHKGTDTIDQTLKSEYFLVYASQYNHLTQNKFFLSKEVVY